MEAVRDDVEILPRGRGRRRLRVIGWAPLLAGLVLTPLEAPDAFGQETPVEAEESREPREPEKPLSAQHPLWDGTTAAVLLGTAFVLTPVVGYLQWWKRDSFQSFHFANERWFQKDTYGGGADKASHIYYGTVGEEALTAAYQKLGHAPGQSRALALATVAVSSVVVEVGDSFTSYGFSWEDATATTLGALTYAWISSRDWQDTVGFRFGWLPTRIPGPAVGQTPHAGSPATHPLGISSASIKPGYTYEIYTADFKLAGLLPRLDAKPGILRYLLASATYNTRGYPNAAPQVRQRNLGLEIGVNLPEILRAAGVSERHWLGKSVILFLEHFRVPYSAAGVRFDLNGRRWHGPDFGDRYDPNGP